MSYSYELTQSLDWQTQAKWAAPDTPFMSFNFWQALTDTGAIGADSGWMPLYIVIYESTANAYVAVMPVFVKGHHQGEYVFDHAWAQAYTQHGVDYYPRLVTSAPYTPVSGQRIWLADEIILNTAILQTAMQAVDGIAKQIHASSWHGLFVPKALVNCTKALTFPLLERQGCQFLWQNKSITKDNKPFASFDEFLATFTAKKRKNIRAERKKVAKQNLTCVIKTGKQITAEDWSVFYQCYAMTYAIRGQHPYLTAAFFEQVACTMSDNLMLAQGIDKEGGVIASSLFFYDDPSSKDATLYGRYWGSLAEYDSLHFELCYYQGIEFAIAQGLQYFDPGTQGEHKLIRGFVPTKTYSLHRIYDKRFEPAIKDFCQRDCEHMQQYRKQAHEALPFNIDNMPDFKG